MTPERWKEIKQIFEQAVTQPIVSRAHVVHDLCHGDQNLELEVTGLLGAHETANSFLEMPAFDVHGYFAETSQQSSFLPGSIIAKRFEILRFLNRGGMGEVYEAWDSELKERVAIKTIRPFIAFDSQVIERFKREVKQARGISHPNVCRVHELFCHEGDAQQRIWFLSMELLEGPTLLERIRYQGPMEHKLALNLVGQMVSGLAAAHALGVVHRDFKSSNVMLVRTSGRTRAVITDFGLALSVFRPSEGLTEHAGQGTPDYIAPEQKKHGEVSLPADQYALGVVMCEMLTGSLPIRAKQLDSGEDAPAKLPSLASGSRWEPVILRCLETKPENRFENVQDVMTALAPPKIFNRWQLASMAALVVLLAVLTTLLTRHSVGSRITGVYELTSDTGLSDGPSLSRDGKLIAYVSDRGQPGNMDVFVQQLPNGKLKRVTADPALESDPSLSPDGSSVAFRSERKGGGIYLSKVDFSQAGGGDEHLIVPGGRNPRFSPDGQAIAYWVGDSDEALPSGEIYVRSFGGQTTRLAADFIDARLPVFSSDGRFILFSGCRTGQRPMPACSDWWVSGLDGKVIKNTGAVEMMLKEQIQPWGVGGWYADRVLFTARKGITPSLWELRLPQPDLRAARKPEQLTSGDLREISPSLAGDSTLAFVHLVSSLHVSRIDGASHPRTANSSMVTTDAAIEICPFVSHNGHWLTFVRSSVNAWSPWIKDLDTGAESPFSFSAKGLYSPIVDDAGDTMVFEAQENSRPAIFVATRGRPDRKLCSDCSNPMDWFEDGKTFFFREGASSSIRLMDVRTGIPREVVPANVAVLSQASWSPENEYLLFTETRQGGGKRVFAVRFPRADRSVVGKKIPVTDADEGSDQARWSGDGKTIFYISTRDGFKCIWGRAFDPRTGALKGPAFPVAHYHKPGASIDIVVPRSFNMSVAGDTIFFDLGEYTSSIWVGSLKPEGVKFLKK